MRTVRERTKEHGLKTARDSCRKRARSERNGGIKEGRRMYGVGQAWAGWVKAKTCFVEIQVGAYLQFNVNCRISTPFYAIFVICSTWPNRSHPGPSPQIIAAGIQTGSNNPLVFTPWFLLRGMPFSASSTPLNTQPVLAMAAHHIPGMVNCKPSIS